MMRTVAWLGMATCASIVIGCTPVEGPGSPSSVVLPEDFALQAKSPDLVANATIAALLPVRDPAFMALSDRALAEAPDLAIAVARIDVARAGLRGARAALRPDIGVSAAGSRQRISAAQFGALPPSIQIQQYQNSFSTSVDANWDLDLFGRLRAGQRASAARLDAATADAAAVRLALTTDIATAIADVREIDQRTELIGQDLQSARSLAQITGVRARAGLVPMSDEVRAQSLEVQAQARLESIAGERAEVIGRLVTLTGLPAQTVLAALEAPLLDAAPTRNDSIAPVIPTTVLRQRPDVLAAERRLAAADAEIAAAAAERFPTFSLTAGLGLISLALGDLLTQDAIIGSLGGAVSGPLLDFGRVGARIDQREAEAREAFASYRKTLFAALGETEAALGGLRAATRNANAIARQAELDRDATNLARERYRRGLTNFLTVLDAERTSLASSQAAATAFSDVSRRKVSLYRAVGGSEK